MSEYRIWMIAPDGMKPVFRTEKTHGVALTSWYTEYEPEPGMLVAVMDVDGAERYLYRVVGDAPFLARVADV
jgi:uncharacterized membrane protein YecN with MAPEG domain